MSRQKAKGKRPEGQKAKGKRQEGQKAKGKRQEGQKAKGKRQEELGCWVRTQKELARLFDVRPISIEKWLAKGGPELAKQSAGYELRAWIRFRVAAKLTDDPDVELSRRKKAATAGLAELELARRGGALIPAQEAQQRRLELLAWMVGVMERAATELSAELVGGEAGDVRRVVQTYFEDLRREAVGKGEGKKATRKRSALDRSSSCQGSAVSYQQSARKRVNG